MTRAAKNVLVCGAIAIAAFVMLSWSLGWAQAPPSLPLQACQERESLLRTAQTKFNETPVASGDLSVPKAIELLMSAEDSWTLIVNLPSGMSCVIASGTNWEVTGTPKLPGKDA